MQTSPWLSRRYRVSGFWCAWAGGQEQEEEEDGAAARIWIVGLSGGLMLDGRSFVPWGGVWVLKLRSGWLSECVWCGVDRG